MNNLSVLRTERGWPGHYCLGDRCMFHRNTLLEFGEERIVVSTVGAMRLSHEKDIEPIGLGRYYETMVFAAQFDDPYWDADVSRDTEYFDCVSHCERHADLEANLMHERAVDEMTSHLVTNTVPYYKRNEE